ncbi:MAG TPA: dodecin family protein [Acidimicrobiales bacterium]
MQVAKTIELSSESPESFEDAIRQGIVKASQTLHGISGIYVKEQLATVSDNQVQNFRVHMQITFALD